MSVGPDIARIGVRRWPVAVLAAAMAVACGAPPSAPIQGQLPPRPNVIVFLVDTLRADAVGFGGYDRETSPRLDRWAERGVVFDQATTPAGWTKPAVMSLFTGLYAGTHGAEDKEHVAAGELVTLAEVFGAAGYETAAFITNFAVSEKFGCVQGFERYRWFDKKVDASPDASKMLNYVQIRDIDDEVRAYLEEPRERPIFAYIHTTDPHIPYLPPLDFLVFGTEARDRYDAEVLMTDTFLGGWFDLLEEAGLLESSIVVLTADHGEEFYEHGRNGHGVTIFQEIARIPLVVWAPGLTPGRRDEQVSLTDLAPTLVEAAQVAAPPGFASQGRSFWEVITGASRGADWSWSYLDLVFRTKAIAFAYREGSEKILHIDGDVDGRRDFTALYDVAADPFEQVNLAKKRPDRAKLLSEKMMELRQMHRAASVSPIDEPLTGEALDQMRSLGYVD